MGEIRFTFEAIGTHWQIDINQKTSKTEADKLLRQIKERIAEFDKNYSRFRDDSLVMEMARKKGVHRLPEDARPMMDLYEKLYRVSEGKFTPLIGNALEEAGYDAEYSLRTKKINRVLEWKESIEWKEPILKVKRPVVLDFGAGGKGYLIDIVAELLQKSGVESYCVDAGGDIAYKDKKGKKLRVGLEHPSDLEQVVGVAEIGNESICGSAGSRRKWGEFIHIIDPDKLRSPEEVIAAWVVAETTMLADGLSTCLFMVEAEKLEREFEFEYAVIYKDMSLKKSDGFPAEWFT